MTEISRRQVLAGAGRLAAGIGLGSQLGLLAGCGDPAGTRPDWEALEHRMHGGVLRPGETGYRAASTPLNLRYADIRPAGVAMCESTADAVTALNWARDNNVRFAVRSGGHSYAGYSASHGLVISLARINRVQVDARTLKIRIGAGAKNRDLYAALAGKGVAVPSGRCPTVGISGLLLGGGFGFASRHFGLTCDHLLSTEVVTATGRVLDVSKHAHQDLFWACQGGGGGNFGINTGFALRAVPVGRVSVYKLAWPWRSARTAFSKMIGVAASAPRTFSCRTGIEASGGGPATGGTTKRTVTAVGMYFGPPGELTDLLAPALAVTPSERMITETSYTGGQALLAHSVPSGRFASKSRYLDRAPSHAAVDTLVQWLERWPGSSNPGGGGATVFAWGGAIGDVPPDATAFVHRDAAFLLDTETSWGGHDSARVAADNLDWVEGFHHALAPYATQQAYQNFIDPALKNWQSAYYAQNLARLTRVKRAYDPDDVFRFPQSVPDAR